MKFLWEREFLRAGERRWVRNVFALKEWKKGCIYPKAAWRNGPGSNRSGEFLVKKMNLS
jgi:hypothetical protein